jgi:hypothetical protein
MPGAQPKGGILAESGEEPKENPHPDGADEGVRWPGDQALGSAAGVAGAAPGALGFITART